MTQNRNKIVKTHCVSSEHECKIPICDIQRIWNFMFHPLILWQFYEYLMLEKFLIVMYIHLEFETCFIISKEVKT